MFKNIISKFKKVKTIKTDQRKIKYQAWVDIETTGTDANRDFILQVACIITDHNFKIIEEQEWIIKQDVRRMKSFSDDFVVQMHEATGLWDRLKDGTDKEEVDKQLFTLLRKYFGIKYKVIIGGNSVHFDLEFLNKNFSETSSILSHRVLDVSALLKFMRTIEKPFKLPKHTVSHDALDDIRWSITQAKAIEGAMK